MSRSSDGELSCVKLCRSYKKRGGGITGVEAMAVADRGLLLESVDEMYKIAETCGRPIQHWGLLQYCASKQLF